MAFVQIEVPIARKALLSPAENLFLSPIAPGKSAKCTFKRFFACSRAAACQMAWLHDSNGIAMAAQARFLGISKQDCEQAHKEEMHSSEVNGIRAGLRAGFVNDIRASRRMLGTQQPAVCQQFARVFRKELTLGMA